MTTQFKHITLLPFLVAVLGIVACAPKPTAMAATQALPYTFKNVVIKGGGFVTGLIPDPSGNGIVYARTDVGGSYRWNPATKTWTALTDFVGIDDSNLVGTASIAVDPSSPNRVYFAQGTYTQRWAGDGAIFASTDRGTTMVQHDLPFKVGSNELGRSCGERLAVDPNDGQVLYFGSENNGLWRSPDYGATWTQCAGFPVSGPTDGRGVDIVLFQRSSGVAGKPTPVIYTFVSTDSTSLYRSADAGETWQAVPGEPTGLMPSHAAFDYAGNLYALYSDTPGPNRMSTGALWKLSIATQAWTQIALPDKCGWGSLAVDAAHPGTLIITTMDRYNKGDGQYRTTDGGLHWTDLNPLANRDASSAPWMMGVGHQPGAGNWEGAIEITPGHTNEVMYGTGGGIWRTGDIENADSGQPVHWSIACDGFEETVPKVLVSPPSGPHLISALADIGTFRSDDIDQSPTLGAAKNPRLGTTTGLDFASLNPLVVARVGSPWSGQQYGGCSLDGGVTWTPFLGEPEGLRSGKVAVNSDGSVLVWSPEKATPIMSNDHGQTWAQCSGLSSGTLVSADRVNAKKFYAIDPSNGTVSISTDGGASFAPTGATLPAHDRELSAVPGIEGDVWAVAGDTLFHSTDSGATFAKMTGARTVYSVGFGMAAPRSAYPAVYIAGHVGAKTGVFRSDDGAQTFARITDDTHQYGWIGPITGDPRVYGRVYFGTGGRGVVYADPE